MTISMLHGILEWFIIVSIAAAGYAADRFLPGRRFRYPVYAALLLAAFIFDLNEAVFRLDALNAVWYGLILLVIAEVLWICIRKKSRPLLCGAFVVLPPVFLFVFGAALLFVPLPCHERIGGAVGGEYADCAGKVYSLSVRPSFDPFRLGRVYTLDRNIRFTPLKRQVDSYVVPRGYAGTWFVPQWECVPGGAVRAHLAANEYILWTLRDKIEE